MPDRRRRAALLLPPPAIAGWHPQPTTAPGLVLLPRERKSSSDPDAPSDGTPGPSTSAGQDDNPFAPPPADAPDQEWRPRPHLTGQAQGDAGDGGAAAAGPAPAWGSQWSSRQPGRQGGGFGSRPGRGGGQGGPGGPGGGGPAGCAGTRPTRSSDGPATPCWQACGRSSSCSSACRRWRCCWARSPSTGASARCAASPSRRRRAPRRRGEPGRRRHPAPPGRPGGVAGPATRPQTTAAIAGLVTASLALMMVAATFTVQVVYRDYFTCVNDALTQSASKSCENLLPPQLRPLLSQQQQ
ncbi:hypothetical protein O1L44_12475 [Streptomyces noursei]|nr:hypothetical protein [Streptomyces noursei]